MKNTNKAISCRLGRRPVIQGPRNELLSGAHCDKSTTTYSCTKCAKTYIRRLPFENHVAKCKSTRSADSQQKSKPSMNCEQCGKGYRYASCLKKHQSSCSAAEFDTISQPDSTPSVKSTTEKDRVLPFKKTKPDRHPERQKVIIWKATRGQRSSKDIIKMLRLQLNIHKDIQIFIRGKKREKRVELCFKDRKSAITAMVELQELIRSKKLNIFCTIGRSYAERMKKHHQRGDTAKDPQNADPTIFLDLTLPHPRDEPNRQEDGPLDAPMDVSNSSQPTQEAEDTNHDAPQESTNSLRIMHWNAQSISNKIDEFRLLLRDLKIDIACLSETRILDNEKWKDRFKGYSLHNFARPNREGGGVCILARNNFGVSKISTYFSDIMEYISADITIAQDVTISVTSIYAREGCKKLAKELDPCVGHRFSYLGGDFNAKHALWGSTKSNASGHRLLEWVNENNLIILNGNQHTYQSHSSGATDSMDISIASPNLAAKISKWYVTDDSLGSDHFPCVSCLEYPCDTTSASSIPRWNMKKGDREAFTLELEQTVDRAQQEIEECCTNIDEKVETLTSCIIDAAEKTYPMSKPRKRRPAPWWNEEIALAIRKKRKARRRWKQRNSMENRLSFKKQQAIVKRLIKTAKRSSWREFVSSINRETPSSVIWKRIKSISGMSQSSPSAIVHEEKVVVDKQEQARLFGEHFSTKCSLKDNHEDEDLFSDLENLTHQSHDAICEQEDPCDVPFTIEELDLALTELSNSATGSDRIHNQMLKDLPSNGKTLVLTIINEIWEEGKYPSEWKVSKIIPLLKPNKDKQQIKSYRPIALTSCLGKLTERMINRRLVWRLDKDNVFHPSQCGFRPKSGTTDALLKITEKCHEGLHQKKYSVLVFLDLEGAFDKVWWDGLITKAACIGIAGNMLQALKSFLSDRFVQVQVGDVTSEKFSISAGTPQGSVISPTIFNIMMYDLPLAVLDPCGAVTYADDGTLEVTHSDLLYIVQVVNRILVAIDQWAVRWKLTLSKEKTEYTVITNKRKHVKPLDDLGLTVGGEKIKYNRNPKSLGLILDPKLTWSAHIDRLVEQCTKRLNLMRIIASQNWGADLSSLRAFYLAFIRSKIGYAVEIWSSCSNTQLQKVCRIQNAALRLITGALKSTPIAAMEIEADIPPLDLFIESIIIRKRIKSHFMPDNSPGRLHKCYAPLSFFQRAKKILKSRGIHLPSRSDPSFTCLAITSDTPPWEWSPPEMQMSLPTPFSKSEAPHILLHLSLEKIHEEYKDCTTVYTDGSLNPLSGTAGAGVYIPSEDIEVIIPLPPCSILLAELTAIERALQEICLLPTAQLPNEHFVILTDSRSSLQTLASYNPTEYYQQCVTITNLLRMIPAKVTIQWIPSHVGIAGNDKADSLANIAALHHPVNKPTQSLSSLLCQANQLTKVAWCDRWKTGSTGREYFEIQSKPNLMRYRNIPRKDQVYLSRLKMNHFPTQSYLHRVKLADDPTCPLCGKAEETIRHIIFECEELTTFRSFPTEMSWKDVLNNTNNEWGSISSMLDERKRRIYAKALLSAS